MNTALIVCCFFVAVFKLHGNNRHAAFILLFLTIFFNMIGDLIPAAYMTFYYTGAALNDLLIIYILSLFTYPTKLIILFQRLSLGFIFVNLIAWVLYMLYVSYTEFIMMYTVMYLGLLLTISSSGDYHALGDSAMDGRYPRFFSNHPARNYVLQTHKNETRT